MVFDRRNYEDYEDKSYLVIVHARPRIFFSYPKRPRVGHAITERNWCVLLARFEKLTRHHGA